MYTKIFKIVLVFLGLSILYKCSVTLKVPTQQDADLNKVSLDTLIKGHDLYVAHCNSCHGLYLPEKLTATHWDKSVAKMQKRAKLSNEDAMLVLKYVKSNCKKE